MKKALLIFAITLINITNAQKGTYLVSGSIGFNSTKNSAEISTDNQNFNFNPKLGYQFSDNFTLGIESNIGQNSWTRENENYESLNSFFSVGSFLRYTKTLSDSFSFFADLGVGYQSTNNKFTSNTSTETNSRANGFYTSINPLLHLKIKNGFGLNFGLGGISYSVLDSDEANNTESNIRVSFGQAFTVGVQKNF